MVEPITVEKMEEPIELTRFDHSFSSPMIFGFEKFIIAQKVWSGMVWAIFKVYRSPFKIFKTIRKIRGLKRQIMGDHPILKLASVDGRYFWTMNSPGWPSPSFDFNYKMEAISTNSMKGKPSGEVRLVLMSITKKCPMKCEHCFEWDALNKKETLTLRNLKDMVRNCQDAGVSQIQFGGGEPLTRINDLIELLNSAKPVSDFWVTTSGFNLTEKNAIRLKQAGLTGVAISLDHYDPVSHNSFRGYQSAFQCVEQAARNANKAKLVVAMTICATRDFISEDNLMRYAHLARKFGASFIQILEPRAAGHYEGKDVMLTRENEIALEEFFTKLNYSGEYLDMPIVIYHGQHQRRSGCFGAGIRYLYVDTDGDIHACPFCRKKSGNVLSSDMSSTLESLRSRGCHKYELTEDKISRALSNIGPKL